MNRPILITILVSLFIHLAFLLPLLKHAPEKALAKSQPKDQTVEINLVPPTPKPSQTPQKEPLKEPQPEDDTPPPPRHMEDDRSKANTSDGLAEKSGGKPSKASQKGDSEPQPKPASEKELIASQHESKQAKALKAIFGKETKVQGGEKENNQSKLNEISDLELDDSLVESPLSKIQEEKARWFNEALRRITDQVSYIWVKPDGIGKNTRGVIQLKLDQQGYLLSSWIHLPSGNRDLDDSALRAIRGVIRYQIPSSPKLSRYYRNLKFEYSGG